MLIMGIEGKCSSISFLYSMVVFSLNLLLKFYWSLFLSLLFVAQKVSKSSASEYNTSLLADCKRAQPTLLKRAQHRQNHCLRRTSAAAVACDFDSAVFEGSNFCKKSSPSYVRGTTRVSVVCDDGRFIFPKESRACEAPDRGEGVRIK